MLCPIYKSSKLLLSKDASYSSSSFSWTTTTYCTNSSSRAKRAEYQERKYSVKEEVEEVFDQLATTLKINTPEDWYSVPTHTVQNALATYYNGEDVVQQERRSPKDRRSTRGHKRSLEVEKHRLFFDEIASRVGVTKPEDWYSVSADSVIALGGSFVNTEYHGSLTKALSTAFPEYTWNHSSSRKPRGYWQNVAHQRSFFDKIAADLNVKTPQDWYSVGTRTVARLGGSFAKTSVVKALRSAYPEQQWKDVKQQKPGGYWNDVAKQRVFFDTLARKLNIKNQDDWYSIPFSTILRMGGSFVKNKYNSSLVAALRASYPEHAWTGPNKHTYLKRSSKSHLALYQILLKLFPQVHVVQNFRFDSDHAQQEGLAYYEFDIFLPMYSIALEYQGEVHYFTSSMLGSAGKRQRNDAYKASFAKRMGITLITIPFWWDGTVSSLAATIHRHRWDVIPILPAGAIAIPSEMPSKYKKPFVYKRSVAQVWEDSVNPAGMLMLEKFDGLRVYWDGVRLHLSQVPKVSIEVPASLGFPSTPFEGELWMGYNKRSSCESFWQDTKRNWANAKIIVFDAPHEVEKPYLERLELLHKGIPRNHLVLSLVAPVKCGDRKDFEEFSYSLNKLNSEGVVLRDSMAWYFQQDSFFHRDVSCCEVLLTVISFLRNLRL